jgi:hypothetical protein
MRKASEVTFHFKYLKWLVFGLQINHHDVWFFTQAGQYEVVEAKVIDNDEASDHRAIVAEVKFYVK